MLRQPETFDELCDYIEAHACRIFIREQIDGKWGSFALSELPGQKAVEHTVRFLRESRIPVRLKTPEEMESANN